MAKVDTIAETAEDDNVALLEADHSVVTVGEAMMVEAVETSDGELAPRSATWLALKAMSPQILGRLFRWSPSLVPEISGRLLRWTLPNISLVRRNNFPRAGLVWCARERRL